MHTPPQRRHFMAHLSACGAALVCGAGFLTRQVQAQNASIGTVERLQGQVSRINPAGSQVLQVGSALHESDSVVSAAGGEAVIKFVDGSVLALRPLSEVTLAQYRFNQQKPAEQAVWLQLVRGGLRVVTGLIAKSNPASVRYTTATATVGIRGTEFELTHIDPPPPADNAPQNTPAHAPAPDAAPSAATPNAGSAQQAQPGTYTKVFAGTTTLTSNENNRQIEVPAGQSAFAPNLAVALAVGGTVIQELGLLRNTPVGVFFNGRFDGTMQSLSNTMMNQLQQRINQQLPSEIRQIIPNLGNIFRR
jgi:FecR protein